MALKIMYSSRTEDMVADLLESLGEGELDPGLARFVLLPSKPLTERVQVELARKVGVSMGVKFLLPAAFINYLSEGLQLKPLHASWTPEGMTWRVLELLGPLSESYPRLKPACADVRARFALAREVADRFDQYMHFRPDLIAAWDEGKTFNQRIKADKHLKDIFKDGLPDSALEDEAWQRELWTRLGQSLKGHPHPKARMDELFLAVETADLKGLGPSVEVLATGPLPFPLLNLLKEVGARMAVNLRVLMPSTAFLDGIKSKMEQWSAGEDEDLDVEAHPLLAQMGRQSIEAFKGLIKLSETGQEDEYNDEAEDPRLSLLARLQNDIRNVRQPDPAARPVEEALIRSLRVHRCYGAQREVEALRDELMRAFGDLEGLKPEEVLILTSDLELYGPLVEAVLAKGEEPRLPLALAELSLEQSDPLFKAVCALLNLASSRGEQSELLAFLDLPAVRARLGEDAADILANRLQASGITFGFDAGHRENILHAGKSATGTWRSGLDRLLAGVWLGEAPAAVDASGAPALAVTGDLGGGTEELLVALQWCDDLLKVMLEWQSDAAPAHWADRLEGAFKSLLETPRSEMDAGNLRAAIASLRQASSEHQCSLKLNAACAADQFQAMDADANAQRKVGAVGGRIALGGFKPLRALPCRVLAVLGLSDAAFPRRSQAPAWDLLAARHMPGDRDPRKEDRQLFLDALLAAKDRVILTAPARSQRNDKPEPVSVCLEELIRAAQLTMHPRVEGLILDHPLQRFSARNFAAIEPSFDSVGLRLRKAMAIERVEKPFDQQGASAPEGESVLPDLDGLLAFFKDPARAWLRGLGMAPPHQHEDPAEGDDEPIDLDPLQRWQLGDVALNESLGEAAPFFLERLSADRVLPQGELGLRTGELARAKAVELAAGLKTHAGGVLSARKLVATLAGGELQGMLQRGSDDDGFANVVWTTSDIAPSARAATMLDAWMKVCLASASGDPRPLLAAGFHSKTKNAAFVLLPEMGASDARAHLEVLLKLRAMGLRSLLPLAPETSLAIAEALAEDKDPLSAAEDVWIGTDWKTGEGKRPSYAKAWRGQNPLEAERFKAWRKIALEVWGPILKWWSQAGAVS